jgi:hypothetical protein
MVFDIIVFSEVSVYSWIILALGVLNYVLGFHYLIMRIARMKNKPLEQNNTEYEKERVKFLNEYDRANPVTQGPALVNYLKFLQGKDSADARHVE